MSLDYMVQELDKPYSQVNKFATQDEAIHYAYTQSGGRNIGVYRLIQIPRLQAIVRNGAVFLLTDYDFEATDSTETGNELP